MWAGMICLQRKWGCALHTDAQRARPVLRFRDAGCEGIKREPRCAAQQPWRVHQRGGAPPRACPLPPTPPHQRCGAMCTLGVGGDASCQQAAHCLEVAFGGCLGQLLRGGHAGRSSSCRGEGGGGAPSGPQACTTRRALTQKCVKAGNGASSAYSLQMSYSLFKLPHHGASFVAAGKPLSLSLSAVFHLQQRFCALPAARRRR